jgi:hypothetical protein
MFPGSNQRIPEYTAWTALCIGLGATSYVELGCGSSHEQHKAGMRVVTVDLLPNGLSGIHHVQGDSHDPLMVPAIYAILDGPPDIVFIDADHSYEGCKADFDLWHPVARIAVGFHDILLGEGCNRFWDEISQQHPSVQIVGRDHASAAAWQGSHNNGHVNAGGIGVIFK